jgi:hypothetical protein
MIPTDTGVLLATEAATMTAFPPTCPDARALRKAPFAKRKAREPVAKWRELQLQINFTLR